MAGELDGQITGKAVRALDNDRPIPLPAIRCSMARTPGALRHGIGARNRLIVKLDLDLVAHELERISYRRVVAGEVDDDVAGTCAWDPARGGLRLEEGAGELERRARAAEKVKEDAITAIRAAPSEGGSCR